MTIDFTSKLPHVGTTIFTEMSALATKHGAINLGQGFPDFEMDHHLADAVCKAMKDGHNQYVPMAGYGPLREAIAAKVETIYHHRYSPQDCITITPGGTYAIYTALTTLLHPGNEVIVFEPNYDSYIPNIEVNGAIAITIPLNIHDYSINWHLVEAAINPKTKVIVLNSPHNPTGAVLGAADMAKLEGLVLKHNLFIVSDEVYEHLIFDGKKHESMLAYPALAARAFVCFSFGKLFHCTGWKIGYCIAPAELTKEFRKVHQFNCFSVNSPAQVGLASFIANPANYINLSRFLQQKRDALRLLLAPSGFCHLPSYGSYFELYNYSRLSKEPERDFAIRLLKDAGVATIPVSAFYRNAVNNHVLRFCFAKKIETLQAAAFNIITWANNRS